MCAFSFFFLQFFSFLSILCVVWYVNLAHKCDDWWQKIWNLNVHERKYIKSFGCCVNRKKDEKEKEEFHAIYLHPMNSYVSIFHTNKHMHIVRMPEAAINSEKVRSKFYAQPFARAKRRRKNHTRFYKRSIQGLADNLVALLIVPDFFNSLFEIGFATHRIRLHISQCSTFTMGCGCFCLNTQYTHAHIHTRFK